MINIIFQTPVFYANGSDCILKDREFETLSETERLKLEILRLKERNEYLEAENVILKKLDELGRRR